MKSLCRELSKRILPEVKSADVILYGNTKIYMKNEES